MNQYAGVLLVTKDGNLVLQEKDNIPTISNPGMITTFGGAVEKGETPLVAAVREIMEETNLEIVESDLEFFLETSRIDDDGTRSEIHIYLLRSIETDGLEVFEGKGYYEISKTDDLSKVKLTTTANRIVRNFFQ